MLDSKSYKLAAAGWIIAMINGLPSLILFKAEDINGQMECRINFNKTSAPVS